MPAGVLLLYLWLLGGIMGIWSRTGAAQAFAEFMTERFVRGPISAKLVAWSLGVIFFQGGTVSTVLVGTTVKPIADKEKISHEELAYIVDSTASPNRLPTRIQRLARLRSGLYLRLRGQLSGHRGRPHRLLLQSVPFCFYAIFAVLGTFLLSIENPSSGPAASGRHETLSGDWPARRRRSRALECQGVARKQCARWLQASRPEFFLPLGALIGIAIGTFIVKGSPNVQWAFGVALLLAAGMALAKGMALRDLIGGFHDGLKGVVLGSVILLLAITIGGISKETGGGIFLVEKLGHTIPYFLLPVLLQLLTMVIAFSTGTSWGTYAVAFPLAMPLAWAVAGAHGLSHPELFMTLCFASVMDGSVYGDQCSPISDTTVLSSMCTGCDLMDHVKTQIPQASLAAGLAAVCWTLVAFLTA